MSFGEVPVRYKSTKTILVRNIGNRYAKFEIHGKNFFEVVPNFGFLQPNESMQLDIHFIPKETGSFEEEIVATYDTGEKVHMMFSGVAEDAIIRLEKSSVRMDTTSIGLISVKTIKIINRSDISVCFLFLNSHRMIE